MSQDLLERKTAATDTSAGRDQGFGVVVQLEGRAMQEIPLARKIVLAIALAAALTSSALGAYFFSGQATGTGANLQTSVTQCPMTN